MDEIKDILIQEFETEEIKGVAIVPPSKTRKVIIPSPPSVNYVPINPRPCFIYIAEKPDIDIIKNYANENEVVFVIPNKGDAEKMATAYDYAKAKAASLNIKKDKIFVKADSVNIELANEIVEIINEEADIDEAEVVVL